MPDSISAIIYDLKDSWKWIWTVGIWIAGFLTAPALIEKTPDALKIIPFLTIASLLFCGAIPLVKGKKNTVHNITGILAGILSQVCVAIINPKMLIGWALYPIAKILQKKVKRLRNKDTFIAEMICWMNTMLALI